MAGKTSQNQNKQALELERHEDIETHTLLSGIKETAHGKQFDQFSELNM